MCRSLTYLGCLFFGIGVCLLPVSLSAVVLDEHFDLEELKGKKVGYYIGSFDPIHLGHQYLIDTSLDKKHVDYVLVYPVPGGDKYKQRSSLALRQKMLKRVYQDHSKVLVTQWTPKELQDNFLQIKESVEIIGLIGSDVIEKRLMSFDEELRAKYHKVFMRGVPLREKHFYDSAGAIAALKADSFLVFLRGDIDLAYLNGYVNDRPIRAIIQSTEISSTEVRRAVKENQVFEQFLSFSVQAMIKEEGLYGLESTFDSFLQQELLEMKAEDQACRMQITDIRNSDKKDIEGIINLDKKHNSRLKAIVQQYGWPGVSLVGLKGANAMWLLVQHQDLDPEFQQESLQLLDKAASSYEAPMRHYAYLTDRVNVGQGLLQIYGTQWKQEAGQFVLYPVADIKNLDAHRLKAGLCSVSEYKESMKEMYHLKDEDFGAER